MTLLEQAVSREIPTRPDIAVKQPTHRRLAEELGIRRVDVLHRHRDNGGYHLSTMRITLSGGDSQVHDWRCDLPPLPPAWACRSPDGCREPHVDGTYCRMHHRLYRTPAPAQPRIRKKLPPRLDLLR